MLHCKRCPDKRFQTMSLLRKHYWKVHPETFNNVIVAKKRRHNGLIAAPKISQTNKPEMTVNQLLAELMRQHEFIGETMTLIGGMLEKYNQ